MSLVNGRCVRFEVLGGRRGRSDGIRVDSVRCESILMLRYVVEE